VLRNGETVDIPVILKNQFGEAEVAPKKELEMHEKLGAVLETASKDELIKRNASNGVIVRELGPGKLKSAGILNDFMIISIDQEAVKSKEHLYDLLKTKSGGVLIEGVYPNGKKAFYGFGL
jgi:serine protease Do